MAFGIRGKFLKNRPYSRKYPVKSLLSGRDGFVADCAHHHPHSEVVQRRRHSQLLRGVHMSVNLFVSPISARAFKANKAKLGVLSRGRKIPFLARGSETDSICAWGARSMVQFPHRAHQPWPSLR